MDEKELTQLGWIKYWKNIGKYCGNVSRTTVIRYNKLYNMPVHRLPGDIPAIIPHEADEWLREYSRLFKKHRKKKSVKKKVLS